MDSVICISGMVGLHRDMVGDQQVRGQLGAGSNWARPEAWSGPGRRRWCRSGGIAGYRPSTRSAVAAVGCPFGHLLEALGGGHRRLGQVGAAPGALVEADTRSSCRGLRPGASMEPPSPRPLARAASARRPRRPVPRPSRLVEHRIEDGRLSRVRVAALPPLNSSIRAACPLDQLPQIHDLHAPRRPHPDHPDGGDGSDTSTWSAHPPRSTRAIGIKPDPASTRLADQTEQRFGHAFVTGVTISARSPGRCRG